MEQEKETLYVTNQDLMKKGSDFDQIKHALNLQDKLERLPPD